MPVIHLQHPVHGDKIATMEMEAQHDEEYGWVRHNPAAPAPAPVVEPTVNGLARRARRRVEKED